MSDTKDTALVPTPAVNLRLVALDPAALQQSQKYLIDWCAAKLVSVNDEVEALKQNLDIARKAKWNTARPKAHLRMAEHRFLYYSKMKTALEAGYYIVPDMPCDMFAIRTDRETPAKQTAESSSSYSWGLIHSEEPKLLEAGEGDYRNPSVTARRHGPMKYIENGKEKESYRFESSDEFKEIVFPFALARPQVLDATQRAMALKIFDEIGVCPQTRNKDPMVLGIIKQPKRGYQEKRITFLIAWFLDTEVL